MPEAGSKGRIAIDGPLGEQGIGRSAETPQILPRLVEGDFYSHTPPELAVDCKVEETGYLGKC